MIPRKRQGIAGLRFWLGKEASPARDSAGKKKEGGIGETDARGPVGGERGEGAHLPGPFGPLRCGGGKGKRAGGGVGRTRGEGKDAHVGPRGGKVCFLLFFSVFYFPKYFLNKILNANKSKPEANITK